MTTPTDVRELLRELNTRLAPYMPPAAKTTIAPKTAASYRMHAARRGVRRMAELMRERGYSIEVALEVLIGRKTVRPLIPLEIA
jgi:hypothetical protein